jgi:hypothetical protein
MFREIKDTTVAIFGGALMLAMCNVVTPLFACGLPRIKNILGLKIKDVRVEHFAADEDEDPDLRVPELIDIKYDNQTVTIDVENKHLMSSSSDDLHPYSFGMDSNGSGGLGVMLFGIPGVILSLPIIAAFNAAWYGVYKLTGMDHNYYLFFRRIKNQLDADTRARLKEALMNSTRNLKESFTLNGRSAYGDDDEDSTL